MKFSSFEEERNRLNELLTLGKPVLFVVFYAFCTHFRDYNPTRVQLCEQTGLNPKTVSKAMTELVGLGFLYRSEKRGWGYQYKYDVYPIVP